MDKELKIGGKKILVIGSPGSGKSYFSKQLSLKIKIPVYHLDMYYWREGWISAPQEEFDQIINDIMSNDEWIIDGNYQRTLEHRVSNADVVFFLDIPVEVCLDAEKERRNQKRDDFPSFLIEGEDPEFLEYIKNFPTKDKVEILNILAKYPRVNFYQIHSREEMTYFLNNVIL